jgi:hypothetical protein
VAYNRKKCFNIFISWYIVFKRKRPFWYHGVETFTHLELTAFLRSKDIEHVALLIRFYPYNRSKSNRVYPLLQFNYLAKGAPLSVLMVMDGQGGGIGRGIIRRLRDTVGEDVEILALGTNSVATSQMMKAGANRGATGENAIVRTAPEADIIIGPLGIIIANAMMGEVTSEMSNAIGSSKALKVLIPLTQERVKIVGLSSEPLPHLIDHVIAIITGGEQDV